jgi:hypothetical protein
VYVHLAQITEHRHYLPRPQRGRGPVSGVTLEFRLEGDQRLIAGKLQNSRTLGRLMNDGHIYSLVYDVMEGSAFYRVRVRYDISSPDANPYGTTSIKELTSAAQKAIEQMIAGLS